MRPGMSRTFCPVVTASSATAHPRSFISMPCALARSRTSVLSGSSTARRADVQAERQHILQRLGVLSVQVDLILGAVQREAPVPSASLAVKVVDERGLDLLSHRCSILLTDHLGRGGWCSVTDAQCRPGCS